MDVLLSGRGVEVMKEDKDDFSSRYKIKDNTRKDEYPFETFPRIGLCVNDHRILLGKHDIS